MPSLPLGVPPLHGVLALGAALVGAAAFPPLNLGPLTFVSVCLFLFLLRQHDTQTARNLGLVYGLAYALGTMYWFFAVFGFLAVPLMAIMTAYFGILANLIALTRAHSPLVRAALTALFAVGIEWLRGDAWYLRFPWYSPPHALASAPAWIAPVRWLGTYGLSFAIWFLAAAGAFRHPLAWAGFLALPACVFLLSEAAPDRKVLLVQAEGDAAVEPLISDIPSDPVDLAVLPEYAYLRSPRAALAAPNGPKVLAHKVGSPVVFGAVEGDYGTLKFSNVAVVIDAQGQLLGTFPKQRPVPLMLDGVPGDRQPVFPLDQGVLGVAVCYDLDAPAIAAALVRAGATVFVVPTFDAMSWTRIQHVHHELLLRLRAVENDRWILRAASSGRSEVIDPHGNPSAEGVEIGQTGFVTLPFAHRSTLPLGGQLHWLGPAAGVGTLLFLVMQAALYVRARRQEALARSAPAS